MNGQAWRIFNKDTGHRSEVIALMDSEDGVRFPNGLRTLDVLDGPQDLTGVEFKVTRGCYVQQVGEAVRAKGPNNKGLLAKVEIVEPNFGAFPAAPTCVAWGYLSLDQWNALRGFDVELEDVTKDRDVRVPTWDLRVDGTVLGQVFIHGGTERWCFVKQGWAEGHGYGKGFDKLVMCVSWAMFSVCKVT